MAHWGFEKQVVTLTLENVMGEVVDERTVEVKKTTFWICDPVEGWECLGDDSDAMEKWDNKRKNVSQSEVRTSIGLQEEKQIVEYEEGEDGERYVNNKYWKPENYIWQETQTRDMPTNEDIMRVKEG